MARVVMARCGDGTCGETAVMYVGLSEASTNIAYIFLSREKLSPNTEIHIGTSTMGAAGDRAQEGEQGGRQRQTAQGETPQTKGREKDCAGKENSRKENNCRQQRRQRGWQRGWYVRRLRTLAFRLHIFCFMGLVMVSVPRCVANTVKYCDCCSS